MLFGHKLAYALHHLGMLGREVRALRRILLEIIKLDFQGVVILSLTKHFLANALPLSRPNGLLAPVTGKLPV